jgi:hypothetical protein
VLVVYAALLAIGAGVAIHVEEAVNVPHETALAIASELRDLVERWSGESRVVVDDIVWTECARSDRCVGEIRSRTSAEDVLLLKLQGAPTRIRILAELHPMDESKTRKLILDTSHAPSERERALLPLVEDFFARRSGSIAIASTSTRSSSPTAFGLEGIAPERQKPQTAESLSYVLMGAGSVLLGAGVVVGIRAQAARSRLQHEALTREEISELDDQTNQRAIAADVLVGAAIAGIVAGVVFLLVD